MKKLHTDFPTITMRDLSRNPGAIVDRILLGERLIVRRHGRLVATLQPLDGVVVQPFSGRQLDLFGSPLGDADDELAKLSEAERHALLYWVSPQTLRITWGSTPPGTTGWTLGRILDSLRIRGLARKSRFLGTKLTGRGMVLREALLARNGFGPEDRAWFEPDGEQSLNRLRDN